MKYFNNIPEIKYEGEESTNPFAFKHYNRDEVVGSKTMAEHLRFAAPYWHVMRNDLSDPFGEGTAFIPWDNGSNALNNALDRVPVFFEFLEKIGIDYYCFHDRDVSPEATTLSETLSNFDKVVDRLLEFQQNTGKKLLWGTACLFSHPRYAQGAATSPNVNVYSYAAAQVKSALEATHRLGGEGYTFWGGREGYATLLNTDMQRERDLLATMLHMAVDHAKKIGFKGQFYIEPKPCEPTTHQYDTDAASCLNFLREYGLLPYFKLNIETNHATLAGKTMEHELEVAIAANALGSIDANRGDELIGWDTDQFPNNIYDTTQVMLRVLRMGGFTCGGLNFDAKRRRESHTLEDLFHAHIGGMDVYARGLKIADKILKDGVIDSFISERYSCYNDGIGKRIECRKESLESLTEYALSTAAPVLNSGGQEYLENVINRYI